MGDTLSELTLLDSKQNAEELAEMSKLPTLYAPPKIFARSHTALLYYFKNLLKNSGRFNENRHYLKLTETDGNGNLTNLVSSGDPYVSYLIYPYNLSYQSNNAGTKLMRLSLRDVETCEELDYVEFEFVTVSKFSKGSNSVTVLPVGDSFMAAYGVSAALKTELQSMYGTTTLIGTQDRGNSVYDEAYGGKGYEWFATSSESPFYNPSTHVFDFAYYMQQHFPTYVPASETGSHLNFVDLALGFNDVPNASGTKDKDTKIVQILGWIDTIIASIHTWDPAIKIILCTVPPQWKYATAWNIDKVIPNELSQNYAIELYNAAICEKYRNISNMTVAATCADFNPKTGCTVQDDTTYGAIQSDIHPNATGATMIAASMANAILCTDA